MAGTGRGRRGFLLRRAALCLTIGTALAAAAAACATAAQPGQAGGGTVAAEAAARAGTINEAGSSLL